GLPVPREHLDPVEDESPEQREQEEQHHEVGDAEQDLHAVELWLKNRACCCAGVVSSEATSTVAGESRNTLFVTRSIAARRPSTSPAEKSTRRLASASPMSVRFMITGVPARNASPMSLASLYVRGCTVVIRRRLECARAVGRGVTSADSP